MKRRKRDFVTAPTPGVSDHALVRYLERAKGFDLGAVRRHIEALCRPAIAAGATSLKAEGVHFVFRDRVVVTVTPLAPMSEMRTGEQMQVIPMGNGRI